MIVTGQIVSPKRTLLTVLIYTVTVCVFGRFTFPLAEAPVITLWKALPALGLVLLLSQGLRYWSLMWFANVLAMLLAGFAGYEMASEGWLAQVLFVSSSQVLVYTTTAWLLQRLQVDPRLYRFEDVVLLMVLGGLLAPLVDASLIVGFDYAMGMLAADKLVFYVSTHALCDALGVAALTPALLVLLRHWQGTFLVALPGHWLADRRAPHTWGVVDTLQMVTLVAATLVAVGSLRGSVSLNYHYVLFLPLLWVAARNGLERCTLAALLLNVSVLALAQGRVSEAEVLPLQMGLLSATHAGVWLAALFSERSAMQQRLISHAFTDSLTGLPNRAALIEQLEPALTEGSALAFLALDNFRLVNRDFGQHVGDKILRRVARTLQDIRSPQIFVARTAGDEFAVVLKTLDTFTAKQKITRLLERIEATNRSALHDSSPGAAVHLPDISVSAGLTMLEPTMTIGDALRQTDITLRHAKKSPQRGQVVVFDQAFRQHLRENLVLQRDILRHLERGYIKVYYQPIVRLPDFQVLEVEAVLRWHHPTLGDIPPGRFVAMLEESGVMPRITDWVLEHVLQQQKNWQQQGYHLTVAVNLSAADLHQANLAQRVMAILNGTNSAPGQLILEVTENLIADTITLNHTGNMLRELVEHGIKVAMDDFGVGSTSLSHLKHLPLSQLKIDRSFIKDLPDNAHDVALCVTMINMAHELGLQVVAEGVETQAHIDFLLAQHCDLLQGFLFSKPVTAEAMLDFLHQDTLNRHR